MCMNKGTDKITETVLGRIRKYFIQNYNMEDECCAAGICPKCRNDLSDIEKGTKSVDILPSVFDFGLINPFTTVTRNEQNPICQCRICDIARINGLHARANQRRIGRPLTASADNSTSVNKSCEVVRLCTSCKSPYGRGLSHTCTKSELRSNLISMCDNVDTRSQHLVAGSIIRKTAQSSTNCELATAGPNPLVLHIGSKQPPNSSPTFTAQQMSRLQLRTGLSNTKMIREVIPSIRESSGRKVIESGTDSYLRKRDKSLAGYFAVTQLTLQINQGLCNESRSVLFLKYISCTS